MPHSASHSGLSALSASTPHRVEDLLCAAKSGKILGVLVSNVESRPAFRRLASGSAPVVGSDPFSAFLRGTKIARQLKSASTDDRETALRAVGLDFECAWRYPFEFSAGQLQRLSLARAVCATPAFIVCEDAIANLDSVSAERFQQCLRRLPLGTLFIASSAENLPPCCDAFFEWTDGSLVEIEAPVAAVAKDNPDPVPVSALA